MSCANRVWLTLLIVGIGLSALGNTLLPRPMGSQMILVGFLCIMLVLIGKLTPWVLFYKENHADRLSKLPRNHPERMPMVSTFPNGDFLIAVGEKRYRMWKNELGEIFCQEVDVKTGQKIGVRAASTGSASAFGIPAEIYKQLEKSMRMENPFL
jgi:hypothetical protein